MLTFLSPYRDRQGRISRRAWLQLGLGSVGVAMSGPVARGREDASLGAGFGKARSVILVFASGGQSQLDMWDPKPLAPAHIRGAFQPISTSVPGLAFTEHMPQLARVADKMTVIRSMSHEDLDHGSAAYLALTGQYHQQRSANPPPRPTDLPTYGSIIRRLRKDRQFVYDAVHLNGPAQVPRLPAPGQNGGYLGKQYDPLVVGDVRDAAGALPGLEQRRSLPPARLDSRRSLKQTLDQLSVELQQEPAASDLQRLYGKALEMLASPESRAAFDLSAEPDSVRDRYGRNRSGQACLLARRLVEVGVPWITVMWNHSNRGQDGAPQTTDLYGWDTHNDIFDALKVHLLPRFDQGFSALLEDLDQRGLLDETLVVCMGEFGRAPRVAREASFAGNLPGRKHWSSVYSVVAAGAGVARGGVLGSSDRLAAEPRTDRYGPWDLAATMYAALGIDPASHYSDLLGRPFQIAHGKPIEALYAG